MGQKPEYRTLLASRDTAYLLVYQTFWKQKRPPRRITEAVRAEVSRRTETNVGTNGARVGGNIAMSK